MTSDSVLEDKFTLVEARNSQVIVHLTRYSIKICVAGSCSQCDRDIEIQLEDVIGATASQFRKDDQNENNFFYNNNHQQSSMEYLHVYWYPRTEAVEDNKQVFIPRRRPITLRLENHASSLEENKLAVWVKAIRYCTRGLLPLTLDAITNFIPPTRKPVLFLVNPRSGPGKSERMFRDIVEPVMQQSGTAYHCVMTSRRYHGRDYLREQDFHQWSCVVVVSGDGLVNEAINGLFERQDWAEAIHLPIGIIPAGSGNGLARSVAFENDEAEHGDIVLQAALTVVRGEVKPMDLVCVQTPSGPVYSCLSVGYGILADLDIESEGLRFLGESRFPLWSIIRTINLRFYKAKLWYLPADGYQSSYQMSKDWKNGSVLKKSQSLVRRDLPGEKRDKHRDRYFSACETNYDSVLSDSIREGSSKEGSYDSVRGSDDIQTFHSFTEWNKFVEEQQHKVAMPDLGVADLKDPLPSNWISLEDDFVLIYATMTSHISTSIMFSPSSKMADGVIWLTLIRKGAFPNGKVSKLSVAKFLHKMQSGEHMYVPGVEFIPVKSFRLHPEQNRGYLTIDGENVKPTPIQATVLPSMLKVLG